MELSASIPLSQISKIQIYQNTGKKYMSQIKTLTGADYIINGTIYDFNKFIPFCNVRIDGKTINGPGYSEYGYSWNTGSDIKYSVLPSSDKNYIGCVSMLLNGEKTKMYYNSGMGGKRQRSCIGLRGSNLMLYVCNGGHSKTPEALQEYTRTQGWTNSVMLDGGGSTQGNFSGQILNSTENGGNGRIVQNYILVYLNKLSTTKELCPYFEPSTTIRYGSSGNGAKWVQWHLNAVMNAGLTVDGAFGMKSVAALKVFQKNNGLTVDGLCGKGTRAKLKECLT